MNKKKLLYDNHKLKKERKKKKPMDNEYGRKTYVIHFLTS